MDALQAVLIAAAIIGLGWLLLIAFLWLHRPSRELVGPALRLIPDLVRMVRELLGAADTPGSVHIALLGLLAYLLSPIDLVPDFIPVLGSVDDLVVTAIVLRWAGRRVGVDRLRAAWTGDPAGFDLLRRLLGV